MKIQIWSDIACPFCYIGMEQFTKALRAFPHRNEVEVIHRSFQLAPDAPRETTESMADHLMAEYAISPEQAQRMIGQVCDRAAAEGLSLNMDKVVPVNTLDGLRLLHLAEEQGCGAAAARRLFAAYFSNGENVADSETLMKIGAELGLVEVLVCDLLASDEYAAAIQRDIALARALEVHGVPFFIFDGIYEIAGAQGHSVILDMLNKVWGEKERSGAAGDSVGAVYADEGCEIP